MIHGSAVRVYVNDRPSLFVLPKNKGYRLCQPCDRCVRSNNTHCEKCNGCMSKEGKTYKHCDDWEKCVKPSWFLCSQCQKCRPQDHKCDDGDGAQAKRFVCHSYGKEGHKRVVYPKRKIIMEASGYLKKLLTNMLLEKDHLGLKEMDKAISSSGQHS